MAGRDRRREVSARGPRPYVVVLRVSLGDDSPPTTIERECLGYSLDEAVMSACLEVMSSLPEKAKVVIERAQPSLAGWVKMVAAGVVGK
jgi:hypothetical protein